MAIAPRNRSRRQGGITVLVPAAAPTPQAVGPLLETLQRQWQGEGHLAALWQAWPRIAGPQLAQHCRPLRLQQGRLTVGASHPQWLQALRFSRHQLLGALRAAGFALHGIQIQQHQSPPLPAPGSELEAAAWQRHPCRVDIHGLARCDRCQRPAPAGELERWGHCSFCQRERMAGGPQ